MTLPLRRKHRTTALSIRSQATQRDTIEQSRSSNRFGRLVKRSTIALAVLAALGAECQAQSAGWQPTRLPPANNVRPLTAAQPTTPTHAAAAVNTGANRTGTNSSNEQSVGDGVTLRWRTSSRASSGPSSNDLAAAPMAGNASPMRPASNVATNRAPSAGSTMAQSIVEQASHAAPAQGNPLRGTMSSRTAISVTPSANSSAVQQAAFQQPVGQGSDYDSMFGRTRMAQAPQAQPPVGNVDLLAQPEAAPLPGGQAAPLPGVQVPQQAAPIAPPSLPPTTPPRELNEPAPLPNAGTAQPPATPSPFVDPNLQDPSVGSEPRRESPSDRSFSDLPRRRNNSTLVNCEDIRERLRNSPINKIDLNISPHFGEGLRGTKESGEKERLNFAANSEVREWCTREGSSLVRGRMIDLRNDEVILDIDGKERQIPLRDLCDVDLAYVGRVWNLPTTCAAEYEPYQGRNFLPSAMQWKASELCHKPLYFEEVQLERYGHELGPVLQPLVSSAHFFGNIAVLPYKMGIHPPNECQYALGYYRPGSCAPYMVPPIPFSLRGAAAQAKVVVAGAALIP